MEKYFINDNTLFIMPFTNNKSKVIENYITYIINKTPYDIVNESCKYYGSSFNGRCDATEFMTGVKYKCPIIISEVKEIIMIPTASAKNVECMWINYHAIERYYQNFNNKLTIVLKNNRKFELNLSTRVLCNQIFRASRLESVMKSKKH